MNRRNINDLWMVTGRNRMTGVREQCSMAASKDVAQQFIDAWKRYRARNKAYTHLRLEPFTKDIFTK